MEGRFGGIHQGKNTLGNRKEEEEEEEEEGGGRRRRKINKISLENVVC